MSSRMRALILPLTDDKHQRLSALAHSRHTTIHHLMDEMTTLVLAGFGAQTHFKRRAARCIGRAAEGLALLDKVAQAKLQDTGASR